MLSFEVLERNPKPQALTPERLVPRSSTGLLGPRLRVDGRARHSCCNIRNAIVEIHVVKYRRICNSV